MTDGISNEGSFMNCLVQKGGKEIALALQQGWQSARLAKQSTAPLQIQSGQMVLGSIPATILRKDFWVTIFQINKNHKNGATWRVNLIYLWLCALYPCDCNIKRKTFILMRKAMFLLKHNEFLKENEKFPSDIRMQKKL